MAHEGRGGPVDRAAPMVAQRADAQRADAQRADAQRAVTAFDHAPVGVITTSLAAGRPGAYLTVNEAYCRMVGYGPTDLIGNDFLGDVHPADQPALDDLLQKVLAGESGSVLAQTHLVREDGEIVPVRVTGAAIAPARDPGSPGGRDRARFQQPARGDR